MLQCLLNSKQNIHELVLPLNSVLSAKSIIFIFFTLIELFACIFGSVWWKVRALEVTLCKDEVFLIMLTQKHLFFITLKEDLKSSYIYLPYFKSTQSVALTVARKIEIFKETFVTATYTHTMNAHIFSTLGE